MLTEEYKKLLLQCIVHMKLCIEICRMQRDAGRYFVLEQPATASSWKLDFVEKFLELEGVSRIVGDQCMFGQSAKNDEGFQQLARKRTGWCTNSEAVGKVLCAKCPNRPGYVYHEHVALLAGKAKGCEVYTPALVEAILRGLVQQLKIDNKLHLSSFECGVHVDEEVDWQECEDQVFVDDVTGVHLKPKLVRAARLDEIGYMRGLAVYEKVPRSQSLGGTMIPTRWVDINKGDDVQEKYRSRFVGKELKRKNPMLEGTFAATPPLEALRFMLSLFMTTSFDLRGKPRKLKLLFMDVSRAYLHAPVLREIYVELPPEDQDEGQDLVGRLLKSLYGTRDAGANWERKCSEVFRKLGFTSGLFSPCLYYNAERDCSLLIHGDDFVVLGLNDDCVWVLEQLNVELAGMVKKEAIIGRDAADDCRVCMLNRIIEYDKARDEITYEPDPRHAQIAIEQLGMKGCKGVSTPGTTETGDDIECDTLSPMETALYRSATMRVCYLAQDIPAIQFAGKECARFMSSPNTQGMAKLKRLARYLRANPRWVQHFIRQQPVKSFLVKSDSNFAGCKLTRKSTSSTYLLHGAHLIRASSSTQQIVGLSTGEAEFMALVKGASVGFGAKAMAKDVGREVDISLDTDASAAKGIACRRGVGKVRHLHTPLLWVQQKVDEGLVVRKIGGKDNVADMGTKYLSGPDIQRYMKECGFTMKEGKCVLAKEVAAQQ